jgi:hypothetical protein
LNGEDPANLDAQTVHFLEARCPARSKADRQYIVECWDQILPSIEDSQKRALLQKRILEHDSVIHSLKTWQNAIKACLSPVSAILRPFFKWTIQGTARDLQNSLSLKEKARASYQPLVPNADKILSTGFHENFWTAYRTLWLAILCRLLDANVCSTSIPFEDVASIAQIHGFLPTPDCKSSTIRADTDRSARSLLGGKSYCKRSDAVHPERLKTHVPSRLISIYQSSQERWTFKEVFMDTLIDDQATWSSFDIVRDVLRLFLPNRDDGEDRFSTPSTRLYYRPEGSYRMDQLAQSFYHGQTDVLNKAPMFPISFQTNDRFSGISDTGSVYSRSNERGNSMHDSSESSSGRSICGWISLQEAQQAIASVRPASVVGLLGEDCNDTPHEIEQAMQAVKGIWVYREGEPAQLYKLPAEHERAKRLFRTAIVERGDHYWFAIPKNVASLELIEPDSALEHLGKNLVIYGDRPHHSSHG